MEAEEDLFVVIVGDASVSHLQDIKLEPVVNPQIFNEPVENILKQVSQYGEFINNDELKLHIKSEQCDEEETLKIEEEFLEYYEDDSLDQNEDVSLDQNVSLIQDQNSQENTEVSFQTQLDEKYLLMYDKSTKKPKASKAKKRSMVAELRETYPELQNEEFLVDTVKELMRTAKPPPLPIQYCKHIVNNEFQCTICDKVSVSLIAAGRHYEENHGPRYLTCYACGANYRRKENLYKHEQVCSSPDARIVIRARDLHLGWYATGRSIGKMCRRKFLKENSLICPVCYEQFADIRKLHIHTNTVHVDILLPYKCSQCSAAYSRPSVLKAHEKNQHGAATYICDICSHAFRKKENLVSHLDTHLSLKKYACDQCSKCYTTRFSLNIHVQKVHQKLPPPYVCQICIKRYYRMWELKLHMKKEHGATLMTETAFIKQLPSMTEPMIHNTKVVTKEELEQLGNETVQQYYEEKEKRELELLKKKRFPCSECDKSYVMKVDLNIHMRTVHVDQERPMRCQVCHKIFSRLDLLKRHMKRQHKMMMLSPENFQKVLPHLTKAQIEEAQVVLKPPSTDNKVDKANIT